MADSDISVVPDLSFGVQSGTRVVVQAIARRLITPRGSLFYAPDYGTDIREVLLSRLTSASLFAWKTAIEQECLRDDRVSSATADLTFDPGAERLTVEVSIELVDGAGAAFTLAVASGTLTGAGSSSDSGGANSGLLDGVLLYS